VPNPTNEEIAICNAVSELGASAWKASIDQEGLNTDPRMMSVMLFKRLWNNHKGFLVLWQKNLPLEAAIVLRSGIEAAICITANRAMKDRFVELMRLDAAFTVKGQAKRYREVGDIEAAGEAQLTFEHLIATLPKGSKPASLKWKDLADEGGIPSLYTYHRMLSGASSHVTGMSILRGVTHDEESALLQAEYDALTRRLHLMMMSFATLHATQIHALMIGAEAIRTLAQELVQRMNKLPSFIAE
tara:strand:- start:5900 stop:6631 length:732 start_codon:yes stop_codon:yes gene_type:complete